MERLRDRLLIVGLHKVYPLISFVHRADEHPVYKSDWSNQQSELTNILQLVCLSVGSVVFALRYNGQQKYVNYVSAQCWLLISYAGKPPTSSLHQLVYVECK